MESIWPLKIVLFQQDRILKFITHLPIPAILLIAAYVEVIMTARIGPYNNILTGF